MKKLSTISVHTVILLFIVIGTVFMQSSCKKSTSSGPAPVITGFRMFNRSPNDSVITKIVPGSSIVILGSHLNHMQYVLFDGFPASINTALGSDTSFIVTVPSNIPFANIPADIFNTVVVTTTAGSSSFKFPILAPKPIINSLSNEMANSGDVLTLKGAGLFAVTSITFPGNLQGTDIVSDPGGTFTTVKVPPNLTAAGPITITTKYGTSSSVFNINDFSTGMLTNFDNISNYSYGSVNITNNSTVFPGNHGNYAEFNTGAPLGAYDYNQGATGRAFNLNAVQWVPQSNLSDPISSYALKFEVFIKDPWNGGTLMIRRDEGSWVYLARYEPWKAAGGGVTTTDWTTVTIPLTSFKTKSNLGEGTGNSAPDLSTLINPTGKRGIGFMLIVDNGTPGVTPVHLAVDNVRIVKIQ